MRELLSRMAFFASGGLAIGVSSDAWSTIATIAAIVLGWVWFESRVEKIVRRELAPHIESESKWQSTVDKRLDQLFRVMPKRRGEES